MSRYNRIEQLQHGKDSRVFDSMLEAGEYDTYLNRDIFKEAIALNITFAALVTRTVNIHTEQEREILNEEDSIGPRIY